MRRFLATALLSIVYVTSALADDGRMNTATCSVNENSRPGTIVARLDEFLSEIGLQETVIEQSRLLTDDNTPAPFRLDPKHRLRVDDGTLLNYEARRSLTLRVEVITRKKSDPLRDRFAQILADTASSGEGRAWERWDRQTHELTITVNVIDRPERPTILRRLVFTGDDRTTDEGRRSHGRVIAADPDHGDRLRFALTDHQELFAINKDTGVITTLHDRPLFGLRTYHVGISVVDSTGLRSQTSLPIRIVGPARPVVEIPTETPRTPEIEPTLAGSSSPTLATPFVDPHSEPTPTRVVTESLLPQRSSATSRSAATVSTLPFDQNHNQKQSAKQAALATTASAVTTTSKSNPQFLRMAGLMASLLVGVGFALLKLHRRSNTHIPADVSSVDATVAGTPVESAIAEVRTLQQASIPNERQSAPSPAASHRTVPTAVVGGDQLMDKAEDATKSLGDVLEDVEQDFGLHYLSNTGDLQDDSRLDRQSPPNPDGLSETVDDWMNRMLEQASVLTQDAKLASSEATTVIDRFDRMLGPSTQGTVETDTSSRQPVSEADAEEIQRAQFEEFRAISRSTSRIDIARTRRRLMKSRWLSAGMTVATCVAGGAVCLFTQCFGSVSVPVGTLLLAMAAAMLMHKSLYPEANTSARQRRKTDQLRRPQTESTVC